MKTTLRLELKAAPDSVSETSIPNGSSIAEFVMSKNHPVHTGLVVREINSPTTFAALEGPGTSVTEVGFLYFRASAPTEVEITQDGTARVIQVQGAITVEFDATKPMTLLRVKGVAKIEYFVSGLV